MTEIQLPLPIQPINDQTLDNFYPDNNLLLLNSLQQNFAQIQQPFFYIWGQASSGKSHLLRAVAQHFYQQQRSNIYIPLEKSRYFSPEVLENLESHEVICLDNIQSVIGDFTWETAIFDLFNRIKENGNSLLIISADQAPNALNIKLKDLLSRLQWGEIYQLVPLQDEQKIAVLQQNAYQLGIELPEETARFLLKRVERDMQHLAQLLDQLDKASLQSKRNLTIPFVKEILKL